MNSRRPSDAANVDAENLAGVRLLFVVNVDWFFMSHRLPILRAAQRAGAIVGVAAADTGRLNQVAADGVSTFPIPMSRAGTGPIEQIRSAVAIARVVHRFHPDVVHNVTIKPVLLGTLMVRMFRRQTRVVNSITGFGFAIDGAAKPLLRRLVLIAYRVVLRSERVVVVVENEDALESMVEARLANRNQLQLIEGAGVDCSRFHPASDPKTSDPIRVVMASRILGDKGVREFCGAIAKLQHLHIHAILAGPIDTDGNPTALALSDVEQMCAASNVEYVGAVLDMPSFLRRADLFVLPSYHEGLPKVLLEAAACGLPIVATDIAGCRPVVHPGKNGDLVPVRSVSALADAIERLVADGELRDRYGSESRDLAMRRFSIDKVARQFIELFGRSAKPEGEVRL